LLHRSECAVPGFASANAPDLVDRRDENLAVADLAGLGGVDDRLDHALNEIIGYRNLYLGFWKKINDILGTTIQFRVAALATEAFDFTNGHSLDADFTQRITHVIEAKGFYNGGHKLHSTVLHSRQAMVRMLTKSFIKDPLGLRYYGAAVAYAATAYMAGFAGLFAASGLVNAAATLLLAHGMIIAAYMIHECGHNMVFNHSRHNAYLGRAMSWFCGAAYGTYEDMRYKHFRHHVDNDDVVWFDYDRFFETHPTITNIVRVLEWFYIPAHDLIMHGVMIFTSFIIPQRRDQRVRNVAVILIRGGIYTALVIYFPKVAILYAVAYLIMMQVLRFMDSVQHDYPYNLTLFEYVKPPHKGDAAWEQEHTFSNPISLRFPRLNWLVLNFGYHNAHHADMNLPFYRLPALHEELTGNDPARVIPFVAQLKLFHRNRVSRIYNPQPEDYPKGEAYLRTAQSGRGPIGGNAASFLTSF
jgi:omega-6 fatty acid desaturase (delta-12 desaturase)